MKQFLTSIGVRFENDHLEQKYLRHYPNAHRRQMRIAMGLAILMAIAFLPQDYIMHPENGIIGTMIRLTVMAPAVLLPILLSFNKRLDAWSQFYVALCCSTMIGGNLVLLYVLETPTELTLSSSMGLSNTSLGVIFTFAAASLRLVAASIAACSQLAIYFFAVAFFGQVPLEKFVAGDFSNVVFVLAIGGFVGWMREYYLRRDFLNQQHLKDRYKDLVDGSIQGVLVHHNFRPLFANQAYADIFGFADVDAVIRKNSVAQAFDQDRHDQLSASGKTTQAFECPGLREDGQALWLEVVVRAVKWQGLAATQCTIVDITARKQYEANLRKLSQAVEQSPSSVIIYNTDGAIDYVNRRFCELTGYEQSEVIGLDEKALRSPLISAHTYEEVRETLLQGKEWRGELLSPNKNGEPHWEAVTISPMRAADGTVAHYLSIGEDISLRKAYEEKLVQEAHYDLLTGLPNRVLAVDRLSAAIANAKRQAAKVALIIINLDRFKGINDSYGHAYGDSLLKEAAERLQKCCRDGDMAARLGGDEFLVTLGHLHNGIEAEGFASRLLRAFAKPFNIDGNEVYSTVSLGISVYPMDGEDGQVLIRNADAALSRAKELGRNNFRFFTPEMNTESENRIRIESRLRHALDRNEFTLNFQPIVGIGDNPSLGLEVLLRWYSMDLGHVSPDRFIALAEDSGVIIPLGAWVLRKACEQAAAWIQEGYDLDFVAVNISSRQVRSDGFVEMVDALLDSTGLPAHCLELEVTEGLLLEADQQTIDTLKRLKALGVMLSIDDFGTGYSSLGYLKRYPFDTLKIDKSFVTDSAFEPDDRALIAAIIGMAHSLGLKVIAEGVEVGAQLEILNALNCDYIQGYLVSRPMPAHDIEDLLNHRVTRQRLQQAL